MNSNVVGLKQEYQGKKIKIGSRGGKFIIKDGKKIYLPKSPALKYKNVKKDKFCGPPGVEAKSCVNRKCQKDGGKSKSLTRKCKINKFGDEFTLAENATLNICRQINDANSPNSVWTLQQYNNLLYLIFDYIQIIKYDLDVKLDIKPDIINFINNMLYTICWDNNLRKQWKDAGSNSLSEIISENSRQSTTDELRRLKLCKNEIITRVINIIFELNRVAEISDPNNKISVWIQRINEPGRPWVNEVHPDSAWSDETQQWYLDPAIRREYTNFLNNLCDNRRTPIFLYKDLLLDTGTNSRCSRVAERRS